jgi:hypothetical protein
VRSTAAVSAALLFAPIACGPGAPDVPAVEVACPVTAPTRLVAAPANFEPAEGTHYAVHGFGDDILFTFDRHDDPDRTYWRLNRCTGELAEYPSLTPGLHRPFVIDGPDGRVLYGSDDAGHPYVIDRFDDPGADEPRPVLGLPDEGDLLGGSDGTHATFMHFWTFNPDGSIFNAAGVGAATYAIYTHLGDPAVPAFPLSDRLVRAFYFDETHTLAHEDSGEVSLIDETTGERRFVKTGVRYLGHGFDRRSFIWQAIGDDIAEPVYLHRLDTGEDVQIAVNEFAASSWGRGANVYAGDWHYSDAGDAFAAAMLGPDERYVTAVRLDTGEAIEIPEHVEALGSFDGQFRLILASDAGEVEAFWDPRNGDVRVWHRNPGERPALRSIDGDLVEYFVQDPDDSAVGSLWRVDLATGEAVRLLADVASASRINATQYFVERPRGRIEAPQDGGSGSLVAKVRDFELVDIATGERSTIVERVSAVFGLADEGFGSIDAFGPDPGLWAFPLPYDTARSARRPDPSAPPDLPRELAQLAGPRR